MIVKAKAPLRISFAGGATDVPPYPERYGGTVISTTINKYAYIILIPRKDKEIHVKSYDYDISMIIRNKNELEYDGNLDLIKATIKTLNIEERGVDLTIYCDAPPGSGLGASSAVVVALIGAFKEWTNMPLTSYEIADLAYRIERIELGIAGGLQDQYAATFGGLNFIEFLKDSVIVSPLRIKTEVLNELMSNLLLVNTKKTRLSANILERQQEAYKREEREVMESLHYIKDLATQMKNALLLGNLNGFGNLLHQEWVNKQKLDKMIGNEYINSIYEEALKNGALGGKLIGAGGGGHFLLYCDSKMKALIAKEIGKKCDIVPFDIETNGLQSWKINDNGTVQV